MDADSRLGYLIYEISRLYGRRFDRRARDSLGLSRAQCHLLIAVAMHENDPPYRRAPYPGEDPTPVLTQIALAEMLSMTAMGVTKLCDRMEAMGWIRREVLAGDRRVKVIRLEPKARKGLMSALGLGTRLQEQSLGGLSAEESAQLLGLLRRVRGNLLALGSS